LPTDAIILRQTVPLLSVPAMLLALACGSAPTVPTESEATGPLRGGAITVALSADVDSWNPYTTHEATSAAILDLVYPRLFVETGEGRGAEGLLPWLAESWEFSDDRLTLRFHLRAAARWSDGTAVTCEDVRFTYRAQMSEELAWPGVFIKGRIRDVSCPDPRTAEFHFTAAYADQLIDANDNAIVPQRYAEIPFEDWASTAWEDRIVTCGPFRVGAVHPGQEAVLERDPDWWGASATYLDRVVLRVYPDSASAVARLIEGEVDLLVKIPPLRATDVERSATTRLIDLPSLAYTYLGWNVLEPGAYRADRRSRGCRAGTQCSETDGDIRRLQATQPHPILAQADLRRALTLAIDRQDLIDGLWLGHAQTGSSPLVSANWAHDPSTALPFDPRRAAELLDEAGWRDRDGDGVRERDGRPLEIGVIVNSENRLRRDVLDRVGAGLARIGVRLIPEPLPRREFVERARDKSFDAVLSGWWAGTRIEPHNLLHTHAAVNRGNNLVSWSTPDSDGLLDRGLMAPGEIESAPIWQQWQSLFREEQPLTVLYEERTLVGLGRRVHGPDPFFLNPYFNVHQWWVAGGDR